MRKLVIDRAAIKNNLTVIKDRAAGAAIYGVVTGDGQGVGAAALAQLLRDASAASPCPRSPRPRPCARRALWTRRS